MTRWETPEVLCKGCWELWTLCLHSSPIWPRRPIPCVCCWNATAILYGPVICKRNWTPSRTALAIHYDQNKPAIIETDASLKGIGAVPTQDGKPVRFLSKALTPAEANYTNIKRELLALLFAGENCIDIRLGEKLSHTQITSPYRPSFRNKSFWHHPDCKEWCCVSPNMKPNWSIRDKIR